MLVPFYCGQRMTKIIVPEVQPNIAILWQITIVTIDIEEHLKTLDAYESTKKNWCGMNIEVLIQTTEFDVDLIPDGKKAEFHIWFLTNNLKSFCS